MPQEIARQWFVPGEGIDRHVISADIQRYLGNDATVRPGLGTGDNQGVQGYWIKAYRNLTTAMIQDLCADSARWRQEQRQTGTREPYVGSSTYHASSAARTSQARREGGDSPSLEGPYGLPPSTRERMPTDNRMQIDPPPPPPPGRGSYQQPDGRNGGQYPPDGRAFHPDPRGFPQDGRGFPPPADPRGFPSDPRGFPQDPRGFPQDGRGFPQDGRGYAPDGGRSQYQPDAPPSSSGFNGRPPVSSPYGQDSRYATSYPQQGNEGAPPGFVRQGEFYVPVSNYGPSPSVPARADNYGPDAYGGQPQGGRDPRDPRYQQPEYQQDPRYAYPSPAATVSSVAPRDPVSNAQQPSNYPPGSMPPQQYNQYGSGGMPTTPGASANRPPGGAQTRPSGNAMYPRPGTTAGSSSRTGRR